MGQGEAKTRQRDKYEGHMPSQVKLISLSSGRKGPDPRTPSAGLISKHCELFSAFRFMLPCHVGSECECSFCAQTTMIDV